MSKYRVAHFAGKTLGDIEDKVNHFIEENAVEVLKYTFMPLKTPPEYTFLGVLEYEVEDDQ